MIFKNRFDYLCNKEAKIQNMIDTVKSKAENKSTSVTRKAKEQMEKIHRTRSVRLDRLTIALDRATRLKQAEIDHIQVAGESASHTTKK